MHGDDTEICNIPYRTFCVIWQERRLKLEEKRTNLLQIVLKIDCETFSTLTAKRDLSIFFIITLNIII